METYQFCLLYATPHSKQTSIYDINSTILCVYCSLFSILVQLTFPAYLCFLRRCCSVCNDAVNTHSYEWPVHHNMPDKTRMCTSCFNIPIQALRRNRKLFSNGFSHGTLEPLCNMVKAL